MYDTMFKLKIRQQVMIITLLVAASELYSDSISSVMNHRLTTTAPLLYKQIDYTEKALSLQIEPWVSGMFDPAHTMQNLGINGQSTIRLDQNGLGNFNPEYILLGSSNDFADYHSTVTFTPDFFMYGALIHFYKQFEKVFFDVRTAFVKCRTMVKIDELDGDNGGLPGNDGKTLYDAVDAFTQTGWNYGKIGVPHELIGFENIQVLFGSSTQMKSFSSSGCQSYFAGFALLEIPTGAGTQSEWLFEPQVGTNHWGFGFGSDVMIVADNGFSLVCGGNFRHFIANWETRSFDLVNNGQWSRYLALDTISGLELATPTGNEGSVPGLPGINLFTQDALVQGRNQINAYARLQKRFHECLFELSYNYFYAQKETINRVTDIASGFGLYDVFGEGGMSTASTTDISESYVVADPIPVTLVTSDLDLVSGAASAWMSSMVAARLQRVLDCYTYGVGSSVEVAHLPQAISTWSVWASFEVLLP